MRPAILATVIVLSIVPLTFAVDPAVIAQVTAAAEAGDAQAMADLGTSLVRGEENLPRDVKAGIGWLEKAAAKNNMQAIRNLGAFHLHGQASADGQTPDVATAIKWYQKAADARDPKGTSALAEIALQHGLAGDEKPDVKRAIELYTAAQVLGELSAAGNLALVYLSPPEGMQADPAKGAEWMKKGADGGDPVATLNLGRMYQNGDGLDADPAKAATLFQKAGDLGNAEGFGRLGRLYQLGSGVEKDPAKAVALFEKSLAGGWGNASIFLGDMQAEGAGIDKDLPASAKTYQRGVELGVPLASVRLGGAYERGEGVARDEKRAFELYQDAARAGEPEGMMCVGVCFDNGIGTEADSAKAFAAFKDAAELGEPLAMKNLSILYANGRGTEKDEAKAKEWRAKYDATQK